ncbi:putative transcriptional regulatory protein, C, partial [Vibrio parahaemolyticus V-223/04]
IVVTLLQQIMYLHSISTHSLLRFKANQRRRISNSRPFSLNCYARSFSIKIKY